MRAANSFLPLLRPVYNMKVSTFIFNRANAQHTVKHEGGHQALGDGALRLPETALLPAAGCVGHIHLCLALDGNVILWQVACEHHCVLPAAAHGG